MLCSQCKAFCKDAAAHPEFLDSSGANVRWGRHSAVLHDSLSQLKAASDRRCPVCRAIYFTPTEYERPLLPEKCAITFELDPQDGEHPVLSTTFRDENGKVLVPKRIVAIYHGLVTDGKQPGVRVQDSRQLTDCVQTSWLQLSANVQGSTTTAPAQIQRSSSRVSG